MGKATSLATSLCKICEDRKEDKFGRCSPQGDLCMECYNRVEFLKKDLEYIYKDLGRNFIGFEISEKYCKIGEERLRQELLF